MQPGVRPEVKQRQFCLPVINFSTGIAAPVVAAAAAAAVSSLLLLLLLLVHLAIS